MVLFALCLGGRVHGGVLTPAQTVDLVTQEGCMLKFQQLRRFLHLTGQALDGGLPLHPAHAAGVQLSVLRFIADLDAVCNGLDDSFWHDAMFFIVGHLDGAAALGLGDGAVHAVGDDIRVHDDKALGIAGRAANGLDQAGLAAQEALLVGIQDGNEADFRQVQTFAQQVIRPTGLLDPLISVRPVEGQVTDLLGEINARTAKNERVLVTTLTKRMAEELTDYLDKIDIRVRYIHSDVDTGERVEIIEDFKNGLFDVLVGVNLLREGLDIPTVSLVAILDADKEGFLRSGRALTQTAGRAARNVNGLVIMYADTVTESMDQTIRETNRRRTKQIEYNKLHHITPKQVEVKRNILVSELYGESEKAVNPRVKNGPSGRVSAADSVSDPTYIPNPSDLGRGTVSVGLGHDSKREGNTAYVDGFVKADLAAVLQDPVIRSMSREQIQKTIAEDKRRMEKSAADLDFSEAARYRDEMWALQEYLKVWQD